MSATPVQIVRRQDKVIMNAVLHTDLAPSILIETEKEWGPIRREAVRKLYTAGRKSEIPQHWHWDWEKKSLTLTLLPHCGSMIG